MNTYIITYQTKANMNKNMKSVKAVSPTEAVLLLMANTKINCIESVKKI
jgi:hypothetical protein